MKSQNPCQRLRDLVSSAPERATALPRDLQEHLEGCAACQVETRASERLVELLEQADHSVEPAIDATEIVSRSMAARNRPRERRVGRPLLFVAPAAAAAMVVVAALLFIRPAAETAIETSAPATGLVATKCERSGRTGGWSQVRCAEGGLVMVGPAQRARIKLSDDTTLYLNHDSRLRLLAGHERGMRLERGEILLDVVRQGDLPPLDVLVPTGTVQVVGTQLQITARASAAVVDVLRGKVIVKSAGRAESVTAGGEAVLMADRAPLIQAASDLGTATEWADTFPTANNGTSGFGTLTARRPGKSKDTEQALRLLDHKVTVRIQGRVAKTIVEEEFHNDTKNTLEGVYKFPLPADAKIAALDLVVNGKWEHGRMVERGRGDKIWRGVIRNATPKTKRRKKVVEYVWVPGPWHDPALLKWKKGSEFELRIYPIPKKGSRRVRIAYTQILKPIPGGRRYVMPLAKDPTKRSRAERFRFEARIGGAKSGDEVRLSPYAMQSRVERGAVVLSTDRKQFEPAGDIVLDIPDQRLGKELTAYAYKSPLRKGPGYAVLSLRPRLPAWSRRDPVKVVFVVDTSYSTQRARLKRAAQLVERVTKELGARSQVHLLACADRCRALGKGFWPATPANAKALSRSVLTLEPLGSTRLTVAFKRAAQALAAGPKLATARVIYLGDGIPTVGELEPARLARKVKDALGTARLTTVGLGGQMDEVVLRALARAGKGAYVAHGAGTSLRATAFRVLQRQWGEPLRNVVLKLPAGLKQVAPAELAELWPGEEHLVAARLTEDVEGEIVLGGQIAGRPYERKYKVALKPRAVAGNAFLPRLWAERRIDDLQQQGGEEHRKAIVKLSQSHHVLSRHTSLLVLESPAMAKAFKVKDTRPPTEWTGDEGASESKAANVSTRGAGKGGGSLSGRAGGAGADDGFRNLMSKASAPKRKSFRPPARRRASAMRSVSEKPRSSRRWRRPWRRRRMIRMKRVWFRAATLRAPGGTWGYEQTELRRREQRLTANPNSRDRTRDLVRWHVRLGDLSAAEKLATKWLAKDRLDAEALMELAGIAALRGNPERSRDLLASAVDVDPRSVAAHTQMLRLYRASGNRAMKCAHAVARAHVSKRDWKHQVAAARCDGDMTRHLGHLKGRKLRRAQRAAAKPEKTRSMWGRLMLNASWDSGPDFDILVVSPRGRVISWHGGARRVRAADVHSTARERLSTSMTARGRYQVWMVPRAQGKVTAGSGTVRVRSYGSTRSYRFTSNGRPVRVADISIKLKSKLVRAR